MKQIPLTQGKFATVDDEDYERVNQFKWKVMPVRKIVYATRYVKLAKWLYRHQLLHRFILDAPKGMQVDHIDGDGLNCTRGNLRLCTNAENNWNKGMLERNKSGYKGVDFMKSTGKWRARINANNKGIHIGLFDTAEEAAQAYDEYAKKHHGEFARLNGLPSPE